MSNKFVYAILVVLLIVHWGLVTYYIGFKP
jgi:hypothetical protein